MRTTSRLSSLVLAVATAVAASAATIELEWTFPDGRVERETRPLVEKDGSSVFSLTREGR